MFNYRFSRARQTVECCFGILECKVSIVVKIVKASCVLHSYLRKSAILQPGGDITDKELLPLHSISHQLRPLHPTVLEVDLKLFEFMKIYIQR